MENVRLIDANALSIRDLGVQLEIMGLGYEKSYILEKVLEMVAEQPTIDPEAVRPKGRWIATEVDLGFVGVEHNLACSVCGEDWLSDSDASIFKFCPNCGAKMEV